MTNTDGAKFATMTTPWIRAGAGIRGRVRRIFAEVEFNGGTANFYEERRLTGSTFWEIELDGPAPLIRWAMESLKTVIDFD